MARQQRHKGAKTHRKSGAPPQRKATPDRPRGLNHVAIGATESGLGAKASRAAARVDRSARNMGPSLPAAAPASVALPSRGESLPASACALREPAFGADFRAARMSADAAAATGARAEHAPAFTAGRDIYFNGSGYAPDGGPGRHLPAHGIALLQQTGLDGGIHATETAKPGEIRRPMAPGREPYRTPGKRP